MEMENIKSLDKNLQKKIFIFPGASSHQLLHYLLVHLNDKSIDTVITQTGINDLLTNSSR